jgi:hypothetical protein
MALPPRAGPCSIFVTVPAKIVPEARTICWKVIGVVGTEPG